MLFRSDESALRLAVLLQMTLPGAPCTYYGSEIGMTGGPDPGCRAAFPWDHEGEWNHSLRDFYRQAIALRHRFPALRTGSFETLYAQGDVYAFVRQLDGEVVIVLFNAGRQTVRFDLPLGKTAGQDGVFESVWNRGRYRAQSAVLHALAIPARDAVVLHRVVA